MNVILPSNRLAEWYEMLQISKQHTGIMLDEHVESYVILTLDGYLQDQLITDYTLAIEFIEAINLKKTQSRSMLRDIGDRCLILSGLFERRSERLNVSSDYFCEIGQQAYLNLASFHKLHIDPELFWKMAKYFVSISKLLQSIRVLNQCDAIVLKTDSTEY
jgi:hypothetical protein